MVVGQTGRNVIRNTSYIGQNRVKVCQGVQSRSTPKENTRKLKNLGKIEHSKFFLMGQKSGECDVLHMTAANHIQIRFFKIPIYDFYHRLYDYFRSQI